MVTPTFNFETSENSAVAGYQSQLLACGSILEYCSCNVETQIQRTLTYNCLLIVLNCVELNYQNF